MNCGCYAVVNKINGKRYIGSSVDVPSRLRQHRSSLRHNKHTNPHLQAAFNKYGEASFEFVWLIRCSPEARLEYEKLLIENLGQYNVLADPTAPEYGYKLSQSFSEKRRKYMLGNTFRTGLTHSAETKTRMSKTRKGRKLTPEHRAAIARGRTGKRHSPETLEKMREARWGLLESK